MRRAMLRIIAGIAAALGTIAPSTAQTGRGQDLVLLDDLLLAGGLPADTASGPAIVQITPELDAAITAIAEKSRLANREYGFCIGRGGAAASNGALRAASVALGNAMRQQPRDDAAIAAARAELQRLQRQRGTGRLTVLTEITGDEASISLECKDDYFIAAFHTHPGEGISAPSPPDFLSRYTGFAGKRKSAFMVVQANKRDVSLVIETVKSWRYDTLSYSPGGILLHRIVRPYGAHENGLADQLNMAFYCQLQNRLCYFRNGPATVFEKIDTLSIDRQVRNAMGVYRYNRALTAIDILTASDDAPPLRSQNIASSFDKLESFAIDQFEMQRGEVGLQWEDGRPVEFWTYFGYKNRHNDNIELAAVAFRSAVAENAQGGADLCVRKGMTSKLAFDEYMASTYVIDPTDAIFSVTCYDSQTGAVVKRLKQTLKGGVMTTSDPQLPGRVHRFDYAKACTDLTTAYRSLFKTDVWRAPCVRQIADPVVLP